MDDGPTYINCAVSLHRSCFESLSDALFQQLFGILISASVSSWKRPRPPFSLNSTNHLGSSSRHL